MFVLNFRSHIGLFKPQLQDKYPDSTNHSLFYKKSHVETTKTKELTNSSKEHFILSLIKVGVAFRGM